MVANTLTTEFSIREDTAIVRPRGGRGARAPCAETDDDAGNGEGKARGCGHGDSRMILETHFPSTENASSTLPGYPVPLTVAGVDVQHAVDDDGAPLIERSAARGHAVHGRVGSFAVVVIPEDFAVDGRVGAQMAVDRSAEGNPGNHRDRLGLRVRRNPCSGPAARDRAARRVCQRAAPVLMSIAARPPPCRPGRPRGPRAPRRSCGGPPPRPIRCRPAPAVGSASLCQRTSPPRSGSRRIDGSAISAPRR